MAQKTTSQTPSTWESLGFGSNFRLGIADVRGLGKRDLIDMVSSATGERISDRTFYRWLNYALVGEAKQRYGLRDAAKLMQFAAYKIFYGSCAIARSELARDIQLNPAKYPQEKEDDYIPYQRTA